MLNAAVGYTHSELKTLTLTLTRGERAINMLQLKNNTIEDLRQFSGVPSRKRYLTPFILVALLSKIGD